MKHCVKLDENNKVIEYLVGEKQLIESLFPGDWIEADLDYSDPKKFCGIGYTYNAERNLFVPPRPELKPDWVLNEDKNEWEESNGL
jgi:hypothetical protein